MAKKDEQPTHLKHLQDHAPTVIHHPEEDQTILYRWLRQGLERGTSSWLMIAGAVLAVFVVVMLFRGMTAGRSAEAEAWQALLTSGGEDPVAMQVAIGELGAGEASAWAFLRAAESRYHEGFADLPGNRDAALPRLDEAQDLFERAQQAAGDDQIVKRLAAMGIARTREARGDLDGAVEQYEKVAEEFPDTPEAARAQELVRLLGDPEIRAFYEQFASFQPEEVTLPPGGTLDLPSLFGDDGAGTLPGLPDLGGGATVPGTGPIPGIPGATEPTVPAPPLTAPEPTPTAPESTTPDESTPAGPVVEPTSPAPAEPDAEAPTPAPDAEATPAPEPSLPENAFAPEAPAAEETTEEPSPTTGELPANPFPGG